MHPFESERIDQNNDERHQHARRKSLFYHRFMRRRSEKRVLVINIIASVLLTIAAIYSIYDRRRLHNEEIATQQIIDARARVGVALINSMRRANLLNETEENTINQNFHLSDYDNSDLNTTTINKK